jgi:hypothetical protein
VGIQLISIHTVRRTLSTNQTKLSSLPGIEPPKNGERKGREHGSCASKATWSAVSGAVHTTVDHPLRLAPLLVLADWRPDAEAAHRSACGRRSLRINPGTPWRGSAADLPGSSAPAVPATGPPCYPCDSCLFANGSPANPGIAGALVAGRHRVL